MNKLYDLYVFLEMDKRKSFLELKEKVQHEIEETLKERSKVVAKKHSIKEELYQHFEEIKSTIEENDLELLKGVDLRKEVCTEGQQSNHKKIICNFYLWDTEGQEDYERIKPLSYPETDLFCACFSTVSSISFENIQHKWIPEIRHYNPDSPIILIGCQADLRNSSKVLKELKFQHFTTPISFSEGELMARSTGCCTYVESSAMTGEGSTKYLAEIFAKTLVYYNHQRELFSKTRDCQLM
ncbi:small GTPase [Naegleria gruberi]|uniref:Small GTPase n=1 Tax=Naegleria gruberi TaxID=5762 RepID=D2VM12_NAEGR|nr:small GTPase [Naegleria gruberi]EFC42240.1 small GTPase [Naegleria gruberi]|eukprot:XP_002674984.1 small GTPase [Naegleria gruberi]